MSKEILLYGPEHTRKANRIEIRDGDMVQSFTQAEFANWCLDRESQLLATQKRLALAVEALETISKYYVDPNGSVGGGAVDVASEALKAMGEI